MATTSLHTISISSVALHPKSHGYIGLMSADPLKPPKIVANYLTSTQDSKTIIAGIRIIQKLANTTVLRGNYEMIFEKEEYGKCGNTYGWVNSINENTILN